MPFTLLLGGARSGKSLLAVELASRSGGPVTFIATGEAGDAEMAERITRHQAERPRPWTTVEEPLALVAALQAVPVGDVIVVDCLTLWVSNLCLRGDPETDVIASAECAAGLLAERNGEAVVVSNEVGLGIVPDNALARNYRDTLGSVNAIFSRRAQSAALVVAGRLLELVSPAPGRTPRS
jgi:adenosyl cobinamide kinase/adenosyl cobinamide phosphate guanylyltransferase